MGVPQKRERTFFIARRLDLNLKPFKPEFKERPISCKTAFEGITSESFVKPIGPAARALWHKVKPGQSLSKAHSKGYFFNYGMLNPNQPSPTILANSGMTHWQSPRTLSAEENKRLQTFPEDFNFLKSDPRYVMGMSVPPFMTQRVALEIYNHWFKTENN